MACITRKGRRHEGSFFRPPVVVRNSRAKAMAAIAFPSAFALLFAFELRQHPEHWWAWIAVAIFGAVGVVITSLVMQPTQVTFDRSGLIWRRGPRFKHWEWSQIGAVEYTPVPPDLNFRVWETKDGPVVDEGLPGFFKVGDDVLARMILIGKRRWGPSGVVA